MSETAPHPTASNQTAPHQTAPDPTKMRFDQIVAHHLLARTVRLLFRMYSRWQIIGLENVPRTGPVLFAANHASYIDPLLGWSAMYGTRRMWGVARADLWKGKVLSYFMDCIGSIPVQRNTADRVMIRRVLDLLAHGETVGIFPEGTRTPDGKLQPAQPGLALLAQKSGAPIVPVALIGTYEMLPRDGKKLQRSRLKVIFGKPMTFAPGCPREEILTTTMAAIAALMTANGHPMEPPVASSAPTGKTDS